MTSLQETLTYKGMEFYTIGVYNSTESEFFENLVKNDIDTFCDIRQRRGVRGSKYSFVNSKRLQAKLQNENIRYLHYLDLAPTKEIRELQKKADLNNSELKRDRRTLGHVFTEEYKSQIIKTFSFKLFIKDLENINAEKVVLFCVEEHHKACHRSIVAEKLSNDYQFHVKNI